MSSVERSVGRNKCSEHSVVRTSTTETPNTGRQIQSPSESVESELFLPHGRKVRVTEVEGFLQDSCRIPLGHLTPIFIAGGLFDKQSIISAAALEKEQQQDLLSGFSTKDGTRRLSTFDKVVVQEAFTRLSNNLIAPQVLLVSRK